MKCEWIATENICQKFYSYERKGKQYLSLNFDLSLSSFRVKALTINRVESQLAPSDILDQCLCRYYCTEQCPVQ